MDSSAKLEDKKTNMSDGILDLCLLIALHGHAQQRLHFLPTSERPKADSRSQKLGDGLSAAVLVTAVCFYGNYIGSEHFEIHSKV